MHILECYGVKLFVVLVVMSRLLTPVGQVAASRKVTLTLNTIIALVLWMGYFQVYIFLKGIVYYISYV